MTLRTAPITLLLAVTLAAASVAAAPLARRAVPKQRIPGMQTAAPSGRVIVKFSDTARITVTGDGVAATDKTSAGRIARLIENAAPGSTLRRRFRTEPADIDALRAAAEARSGLDLPDLNTYGVIEPDARDRASLLRIVERLLADPSVETAYLEPSYVPATLGFDAFTGIYTPPASDDDHDDSHYAAPDAVDSQDYSLLQGYLGAPPEGIGALAVAQTPGGRGENVKVVDVELSWLWNHEDLTSPFYTSGTPFDDQSWRNHGTAVQGVIRGADNGSGVRGVAPSCQIGGASIFSQSLPEAILKAAQIIAGGDIILIELHAPGPNATGIGEYGYVPVEYWQDNFDAILIATASGRIVCEAGGNGQQDLDGPAYRPLFDPDYRNSGAIMCGAARPDLEPEWFSNYGQRLDLHCWGREVATCAYGDLQGAVEGFPEEQWYTDSFSGTSSASAIIAGAVADMQGMARAQLGFSLNPQVMREVLTVTGTPYLPDTQHVGPRPDIAAAWSLASISVGNLNGRVTDSTSSLPIPYAIIVLPEHERRITTGADGLYSINLPAGPMTLEFDEYFYEMASIETYVTPGVDQTRDISLNRLPHVTLSGLVAGMDTLQLAGTRVWVPGKPILPAYTRENGAYDMPGLAAGKEVTILYDHKPWHGAHAEIITPVATETGFNTKYVRVPPAVESFTMSGGYQAFGLHWAWGVPTQGPESAFSPHRCWAVGLDGQYLNNAYATLTSATYTYPDTDLLRLSFHYWCSTESSFDGVNLELLVDDEWVLLEPMTGYTHDSVSALGSRPGWSGVIRDWRGAVFDLSDRDKDAVTFRFVFASDAAVRGEGFFVDDIAFADDRHAVAVEMEPQLPDAGAGPELTVYPNPFNPQTRITWRATRPGPVALTVFDTRGRLVRRLYDRDTRALHGAMTWRGEDDAGHRAPSGVYLIRFRDVAGGTATRRVTLMK
ncbi:S8 family serine peptidase [bacterium]|nr:S8 family serine peptidase [bacterium]